METVNKFIKNKKLGENYIRPKVTATEKLTPEQIEEKLENYSQTDIANIPLGVHVRYFKTVNGKKKFCSGGILRVNTGLPTYVLLSNGELTWSVQVKDTIFFRKMTNSEISTEHKKENEDYEKSINDLSEKNRILSDKIRLLELENKKLLSIIKKNAKNMI
jgi:hypothetical protein